MSALVPLICVPHAGGVAAEYRGYRQALAPREVRAVSFPGREQRFSEPLLRDVDAMARFVIDVHARDTSAVSLWGHSLGALVAYEVAHGLEARGVVVDLLVVAGHAAPHLARERAPLHALPDAAFVAELRKLGGLDPIVEEHAELLELLLPRLRADLEAAETYGWRPRQPLRCPVLAFGGRSDDGVPPERLARWAETTSGAFEMTMFDGGHFFPRTAAGAVTAALRGALEGRPGAIP